MNKKHWAVRLKTFLENVSTAAFFLVGSVIFICAGAVVLTLVWLYTRD
jgi:hypothetical protein